MNLVRNANARRFNLEKNVSCDTLTEYTRDGRGESRGDEDRDPLE